MVLRGQLRGRVGHCRDYIRPKPARLTRRRAFFFGSQGSHEFVAVLVASRHETRSRDRGRASFSERRPAPGARRRGTTPRTKALVGGTLVDGFAGPPIPNSVILIDGDKISAVGQVGSLAVPAGAEVISTEGMTVLPGLWDMHVHTMINGHADYAHWDKTYPSQFESVIMPAAAKQLLLAGVTSARDLGGPLEASIAVRDRINAGKIPGSTLYVSGPFIQHAPYPEHRGVPLGRQGAGRRRAPR